MAEQRLLSITAPDGAGDLVPIRLSVSERLGLPYAIEVEVLGLDVELQASALLTKEITVTLTQGDDLKVERHFHGFVSEFSRLGPGAAGRMAYRLVAVPGIWRLGLKTNCRIFQGENAQEIVNQVISDHGLPAPAWGILPTLNPMPYCTQFNESDLHFVSRLLEEHAMTYYFNHGQGTHTLKISATAPGFPAFEGGDEVQAVHNAPRFDQLTDWRRSNAARSSAVRLQDMDEERSSPSVTLSKDCETRVYADEPAMWAKTEVFKWPGGMSTRPGLDSAELEMGQQETAAELFEASSLDGRFLPGARMSVAVQAEDGSFASKQYVVTAVRHEAEDYSALVAGAGGTAVYRGSLSLVSAARTWMPQPMHHRPVMAGVFSARVTGPGGEQIHVDEFGRIKLKFRWDRLGPDDDSSSIWVRVAQAAAGSWGGTWFLPRVGDEVLVAFMDADADRPVVIGSVYGKEAKPPFEPGENRAQSGIRTRSYKSDSGDDANILRFEDWAGEEEVLLHAQKDLKVEVENDETREIGRDQTETIKNSRTVTIEDSNDTLTLQKGNGTTTLQMGDYALTLNEGNGTTTLKKGDYSLTCDDGSITLEAMKKITLKVGSSTIELAPSGITIKGPMISQEAQTQHATKGLQVSVDGSAMVMIKGGLVTLN